MKLHSFEHVPFENLAYIETWAREKEFQISRTRFYANDPAPEIEDIDWLIVMGGPMNIHEEAKFPWLTKEKKLIERAIKKEKNVLGICLGAQLIADVLGGKVSKNPHKEIGWFSIQLTSEAQQSVFKGFPKKIMAFHWHGDSFQIPKGALHLAKSEACENQAFQFGRAVGLQFHLESTKESVQKLIQNCSDELVKGKFIQSKEKLLSQTNFIQVQKSMSDLLDSMNS